MNKTVDEAAIFKKYIADTDEYAELVEAVSEEEQDLEAAEFVAERMVGIIRKMREKITKGLAGYNVGVCQWEAVCFHQPVGYCKKCQRLYGLKNIKIKTKPVLRELNEREFYELMQTYRHVPIVYQEKIKIKAFEAVKKYINKIHQQELDKVKEEVARDICILVDEIESQSKINTLEEWKQYKGIRNKKGNKPWGGGKLIKKWQTTVERILQALAITHKDKKVVYKFWYNGNYKVTFEKLNEANPKTK